MDLMRDYERYRRLQASCITGVSRDRLLTRPTAASSGAAAAAGGGGAGDVGGSTWSSTVSSPAADDDAQTTSSVVPLPLNVAGPRPLQRSVVNLVTPARRSPAASTSAFGRPLTSLYVNNNSSIASLTDTSDVTAHLNVQV